ncbi:type IV pilus assembly protein PilM [Patescibacteria group bacterium]
MSSLIGLDIGTYSIKLLGLVKKGDGYVVEKISSAYNPIGAYISDDESQLKKLASVVKGMLIESKSVGANLSLSIPDSMAFTSVVELPSLSDAELSSAVQWEAEQHLPVSLKEVNLEYSVVERDSSDGSKMRVLLMAAKKTVVDRVIYFSEFLESEISFIESSSLSLGRSHTLIHKEGSILLCNVGALSTDLMMLKGGMPVFFHSISTGGLALTRALERGLGLQGSQAEEYKRTYGLEKSHLEGKVFSALQPVMDSVLVEMRKSIQYFQSEGSGETLEKIYLSGGGSYIPNVTSHMTESLGIEVLIHNPFEGMTVPEEVRLPKEVASFGVAAGLALRESE